MKTLITGIVFSAMALLGPATAPLETTMAPAPETANVSSPVEIVAPIVELSQVEVVVATEAAPVVVVEVAEEVVEVVTPVEVAVVEVSLPVCMEDEPCWVCSEMGNKICGPEQCAPGLVHAEDGSCVGTDFWIDAPVEGSSAATLPDCNDPKLGDAFAGMAVTCTLNGVELGFAAE